MILSNVNGSCACENGSFVAANAPSISMSAALPLQRRDSMGMHRGTTAWTVWSPGTDGPVPR